MTLCTRRSIAAAMAALAGSLTLVAVPSDAAPRRVGSTPERIEEAVRRGEIDRPTADLHLARAFRNYDRVPPAFRSNVPWDGTLPLLRLRQRVAAMPPSPQRSAIESELGATSTAASTPTCSSSTTSLANNVLSSHFSIDYDTIEGGLDVNDYVTSLETAWTTHVDTFGWAAPPVKASSPPPGNRYHVRVDDLGGGLYGFVSGNGTHAGFVGNNPNTTWNDGDAFASCMVLNEDFSTFPSPAQASLDATTAHEFNHSLQFGYGALGGSNRPDEVLIEGGATWAEDEVFDGANDNYFYLWPEFDDSMGANDGLSYAYWVVLRALTERYGTGVANGGEQVMQDFWEETSKNTGNNLTALQTALANRGTTLADAYHAAGIATKFNRPCGGGYVYPHCLEEGPGYVATAGPTPVHNTMGGVGSSVTGSVEDNYALNWVLLPVDGSYDLTLTNTSEGGLLRASAVCDTGSALNVSAFPSVVGAGAATTLKSFASEGCVSALVVITNESQTAPNPTSSAARSYSLATAVPPPALTIADVSVNEGAAGTTTPAVFNVTLSRPSASTVSVGFATASGGRSPASAGTDYTATQGRIAFAPGETVKTVTVTVKGDAAVERDETFFVNLGRASGAAIADAQGRGTIVNDDIAGRGRRTRSR